MGTLALTSYRTHQDGIHYTWTHSLSAWYELQENVSRDLLDLMSILLCGHSRASDKVRVFNTKYFHIHGHAQKEKGQILHFVFCSGKLHCACSTHSMSGVIA